MQVFFWSFPLWYRCWEEPGCAWNSMCYTSTARFFFTSLSTFSLHCCCCWLVGGGGAGAAVATEYRYGVLVFFSLPLYYYYISWKMREPKIGIYVFLMLSQLRCSAVEVTATGRMKSAIDTKFFRCGMCSKSIKPTVCGPHTGERGHTISGRSSLTLFSPVRATSFSPSSSCRSNGVATAMLRPALEIDRFSSER